MSLITVFGTDWCEDTRETRDHLDSLGVAYKYIDIEQNPAAAAWVRQQNGGKQRTPTVKMQGLVISEPSDSELDSSLRAHGLIV